LEALQPGSTVEIRGPAGSFSYHTNMKRNIGIISGGLGIAPALQVRDNIIFILIRGRSLVKWPKALGIKRISPLFMHVLQSAIY